MATPKELSMLHVSLKPEKFDGTNFYRWQHKKLCWLHCLILDFISANSPSYDELHGLANSYELDIYNEKLFVPWKNF